MRRSVLVLATLTVAVSPLGAQGILGRARDRARQALENQNSNQPATCSPSAYNSAVNTELNDDAMTRFLRAQQARNAEMRRLAQGSDAQGRYYAAILLRDSLAKRHARFRRHAGPDWARFQQLQSRPPSTDFQVNMQHQREVAAVEQSIDENQVHVPELDWNTQQQANGRLDDAARRAGGFDVCGWTVAVDIVPQVLYALSQDRVEGKPDRGATEFQVGRPSGLHPAELRVIHAHAVELADALTIDYPSDADVAAAQAQAAAEKARDDSLAAWNACQQRAQGPGSVSGAMGLNSDSMRVWQQQIEDADKRGDQATVMRLGMKVAQAMQAGGAAQRIQAMNQASQACGPRPGMPK